MLIGLKIMTEGEKHEQMQKAQKSQKKTTQISDVKRSFIGRKFW